MAGNRETGLKAAETLKARYGDDYFQQIRAKSKNHGNGGFKNPELAKKAGKLGGKISKRGKSHSS